MSPSLRISGDFCGLAMPAGSHYLGITLRAAPGKAEWNPIASEQS
jgi:hypothetical protein